MITRNLVILLILCSSTFCMGMQPIDVSVPDEVSRRFMLEDLWKRFDVSERVNPFYLRADLDGDGKPDYVVLVVEKSSRQEYLALVMSTDSKVKLYPRTGREFDEWTVVDQRSFAQRIRNVLKSFHREAFVLKFGDPGILEC